MKKNNNEILTMQNDKQKEAIQKASDKLYHVLLSLCFHSPETRTEREQTNIDSIVSVLKDLPTIKPIDFRLFF